MTESPYKGLKKACMHIGYWYDEEARAELERRGLDVPDKYLLAEGAGKTVYQRLHRYGIDKVKEYLKTYIESQKFEEYPRLTVALDADTLVKIQTGKLL